MFQSWHFTDKDSVLKIHVFLKEEKENSKVWLMSSSYFCQF